MAKDILAEREIAERTRRGKGNYKIQYPVGLVSARAMPGAIERVTELPSVGSDDDGILIELRHAWSDDGVDQGVLLRYDHANTRWDAFGHQEVLGDPATDQSLAATTSYQTFLATDLRTPNSASGLAGWFTIVTGEARHSTAAGRNLEFAVRNPSDSTDNQVIEDSGPQWFAGMGHGEMLYLTITSASNPYIRYRTNTGTATFRITGMRIKCKIDYLDA